ncbi:phage portal protein [bacterium 1XD42-1]|nr:phage portal protein [Oscillospiraceae bacterium]RKJ42344.1 phage portal protein [bacterium 1XD42-8]RKJ61245.1 phage portal protein [bacterium 1XD42-1]
MNLLDKAFSAIAPVHAVKRAAARKTLSLINSGYGNYGANQTKKSMRGWIFQGGSSKEDIEDNIDTLRQRSRDAYMGIPIAAAALKTMRTNVIAGGLIPAPQIDADYLGLSSEQAEALQAQIVREFDLWADTSACDAAGIDNFYSLQQLAFLNYLMNGDAIALLPMKEAGSPYSLQIHLIESDRVCSPDGYDRLVPCQVRGYPVYRIVQGIETDETGAVTAYWIRSHHPLASDANVSWNDEWTRVEAAGTESGRHNILHIMNRERADQLRGVPLLAPVLESLKQHGRYMDAETMAAFISTCFTAFITSEQASNEKPLGEMIPPDELIDDADPTSIEMGQGAVVALPPGLKVQLADPKHPNSGCDVFSAVMIRQIGAALEIPPEVLTKQFNTSFSASRGALNEFWRTCGMLRDWFVQDFCQPVYEEWLAEAVARGRIPAPGFFADPAIRKAYTGCVWNGPSRTALNPVQEAQAAVLRVNAGFSTAQEETAQMTGGDYTRNIRQRIIEAKLKQEVDKINHPIVTAPSEKDDPEDKKEGENHA